MHPQLRRLHQGHQSQQLSPTSQPLPAKLLLAQPSSNSICWTTQVRLTLNGKILEALTTSTWPVLFDPMATRFFVSVLSSARHQSSSPFSTFRLHMSFASTCCALSAGVFVHVRAEEIVIYPGYEAVVYFVRSDTAKLKLGESTVERPT